MSKTPLKVIQEIVNNSDSALNINEIFNKIFMDKLIDFSKTTNPFMSVTSYTHRAYHKGLIEKSNYNGTLVFSKKAKEVSDVPTPIKEEQNAITLSLAIVCVLAKATKPLSAISIKTSLKDYNIIVETLETINIHATLAYLFNNQEINRVKTIDKDNIVLWVYVSCINQDLLNDIIQTDARVGTRQDGVVERLYDLLQDGGRYSMSEMAEALELEIPQVRIRLKRFMAKYPDVTKQRALRHHEDDADGYNRSVYEYFIVEKQPKKVKQDQLKRPKEITINGAIYAYVREAQTC